MWRFSLVNEDRFLLHGSHRKSSPPRLPLLLLLLLLPPGGATIEDDDEGVEDECIPDRAAKPGHAHKGPKIGDRQTDDDDDDEGESW